MENKKHILDLESFRNILHICPRVQGQSFVEIPFEEEILDFIRFLGHSVTIRTLTNVNINKLYQPWRSFAAIINKCLTGKTSGYDSLWLSQAQILWGLYHNRNVDYAFLIREDFVFQVEHKNQKKGNEMYYPRFTKVIIHHFMSKDPSIPRRNKVNWHYVRDDFMFSTIKLVSRHQNTQQFGALLPIEMTNEEIRNSKAYKEYHAIAIGEAVPKPKASARRTRSGPDTSITPPTTAATTRPTVAATPRLTTATKGKQTAKASKDKSLSALSELGGSGTDEGTGSKPGVPDVPTVESEEELSWNSYDDEGADDKGKDGNGDEDDEGDDGEEGEEDDDDEEQEIAKNDDKDDTGESGDDDEEGSSNEVDDNEETRDERALIQSLKHLKAVKMKVMFVNAQLKAEVITRSSHSLRTSYAVATDLSEMELKKILIKKMEGNKSIQRSDEQRNLYKGLVEAYEADKIILDTYGETVILKRRRDDDDDKDEGPSAGSDWGSKRRRKGKEPESASTPSEPTTRSVGRSTTRSKSRQASASESAFTEEPVQTTSQMEEPSHSEFETSAEDQPIVKSSQHPEWFS
uniref:Uncharacterized protein n=1 Tax=Tanacetum cinerariifolium TaxID=118510 RepID=A0A699HAF0_TANCI|nr:hypothetical protein [Tanacetum cinerariifolium]